MRSVIDALVPLGLVGPYLRRRRGLFAAVTVVVALGMLAAMAVSVLSVSAAAAEIAQPGTAVVAGLVIAVVAAVLIAGVSAWTEQWFAHVLAYRVIDAVRQDVHRALARLVPVGLARRSTGDTVAAVMGDVEALEWFAAHTVAQVTAAVLVCATVDSVLAVLFGPVWLLLAVAQAVLLLVPLLFVPRARRQGDALRAALAALSARVLSARASARDVVLLGRVAAETRAVAADSRAVQRARRGLVVRGGVEQAITETVTLIVLLGAVTLAATTGTPEVAPTLVVLASAALAPAAIGAGALGRVAEVAEAARRVDVLLRAPGVRPVDPPAHDGAFAPAATPGTVAAEAIAARYPGAPAPALDDLALEIAAGEHVAIVGESGAGKTTTALVLTRLLATEGALHVDGVHADTEPGTHTRRRVVLVPQQPHVFRATVRENLLAPDATDAELWDALERAQLADHVRAQPAGLDAVLAESGATWSGGERQRLGLARALLRDASVLVLDEPTASLDTRTEAEFLAALARSRERRTTVVITHRPPVMRQADRVLFLAGGRVAAEGTHAQLLARDPDYRALVDAAPVSPSTDDPDQERR